MNKLTPKSEFAIALYYFRHGDARDPQLRERLGAAIDAWRQVGYRDAGRWYKQLATAADRALCAKPEDLPKAFAGIDELWKLAADERSMEDQAELERATSTRRRGKASSGGGQRQQSAEAAPEPPPTRWDERADLQ